MNDKPTQRFDRLLKAMVQGEPPKRRNEAAERKPGQSVPESNNPQDID
jgi:hypothetical protein